MKNEETAHFIRHRRVLQSEPIDMVHMKKNNVWSNDRYALALGRKGTEKKEKI